MKTTDPVALNQWYAVATLADLTDFDAIITDAAPAPEDRAAIDRAGLRLTIARD